MLKELRKNKGLTQKALSDLTGIPLNTLQKYEYGQYNIKNMTLIKAITIAKALGVKAEDLIK